MVADDLDGVLVSADSTVRTESPELAGCCAGRSGVGVSFERKRKICNVVLDADSESLLCLVLKYGNDLSRNSILRTETVTSCKDRSIVELCTLESGNNIKIERFAK